MTDQCDRGNTGENVVIPCITEHFPSLTLRRLGNIFTRFWALTKFLDPVPQLPTFLKLMEANIDWD